MYRENFEDSLFVLLPMACCEVLDIPVQELEVIHKECIYWPGDDCESLTTYTVGWVNGQAGGILGSRQAAKAVKRLWAYKLVRNWSVSRFLEKPDSS